MKYNLFISSLFVLFFSVLIGQDSPFGKVEIIDSKGIVIKADEAEYIKSKSKIKVKMEMKQKQT